MMVFYFKHVFTKAINNQSDSLFWRYFKKMTDYIAAPGSFKEIFDRIETIFRNPKSYTQELVVLIAIFFLIFLLILLLIVLFITIKRQIRIRRTYGNIPVKLTKKQIARFASFLVIFFMFIAALIAVGVSAPSICGQCHIIKKPYKQWIASTHRSVTCAGCHYEPGVYGYAAGTLHGTENLLAFLFKAPSPMQSIVPNKTCLNCHHDINSRLLSSDRQVLVRHKDITQAGLPCTVCHTSTAHKRKGRKTFVMNICIKCHDGDMASAVCTTCHQKDIAYKPHTTLNDWPKVNNARIICTGCHTAKTDRSCIECHEVELPHPDEFRRSHAMRAETKKDLCYKCHSKEMSKNEMCACHKEGTIHGKPERWYFEHRRAARINGVGCNCHAPLYCSRCHDDPDSVYPPGYFGGLHSGMN